MNLFKFLLKIVKNIHQRKIKKKSVVHSSFTNVQ